MKIKIKECPITKEICERFTIEHTGELIFEEHSIPEEMLPNNWQIGLIVGKSGSGKTTLLKTFGKEKTFNWDNEKAIASHFESYKDAEERLMGAGLSSIPNWLKPYNVLSNGEKHRADLAISIGSNMIIDEFVSYVDDDAAMGVANSIQKYIRRKDMKNIVFASLNKNLVNFLKPDWMYDADSKTLTVNSEIYSIETLSPLRYKKRKHFMEIKAD